MKPGAYVVSRWHWGGGGDDDRHILAVYSTLAKAEAAVAADAASWGHDAAEYQIFSTEIDADPAMNEDSGS
jgi:hypothetical protein